MASTFKPLLDCANVAPVIQTPRHPWGALADDVVPEASATNQNLTQLALGENITNTPEYLAANLPPYNQSGLLDHALL